MHHISKQNDREEGFENLKEFSNWVSHCDTIHLKPSELKNIA